MEDGGLTRDAFLGGRLHVWQPCDGYRAGVDAVLLAAAVAARPGQSVLDLGCGVGVATLCLQVRVAGLQATGLEVQDRYAGLARRNAAEAGLVLTVLTGDVHDPPADLRALQVDHVLTNPPYFCREAGSAAPDPGRDRARAERAGMAGWVDAAARRLRPGGTLTVIQRAERLPEILAALDGRFGAVDVLPVAPRQGKPARLVLLRARKGRRSPFRLRPPLILHSGSRHDDADDGYTPEVEATLRHAQPLAAYED